MGHSTGLASFRSGPQPRPRGSVGRSIILRTGRLQVRAPAGVRVGGHQTRSLSLSPSGEGLEGGLQSGPPWVAQPGRIRPLCHPLPELPMTRRTGGTLDRAQFGTTDACSFWCGRTSVPRAGSPRRPRSAARSLAVRAPVDANRSHVRVLVVFPSHLFPFNATSNKKYPLAERKPGWGVNYRSKTLRPVCLENVKTEGVEQYYKLNNYPINRLLVSVGKNSTSGKLFHNCRHLI